MEHHRCRKLISLLLAVLLAFSIAAPAVATQIQPRYLTILTLSSSISISSSGCAHCWGGVTVRDGYTSVLTMELQKHTGPGDEDEDWTTVKTWEAEGTYRAELDKYWYVTRGEYRTKMTAKIYNSYGGLMENESLASGTDEY